MTEPIAVDVPVKPAFPRPAPPALPVSPAPAPVLPRVEMTPKPDAPKPALTPPPVLAAPPLAPTAKPTGGLLAGFTRKQLAIGATAVLSIVAGIGVVRIAFPGTEAPRPAVPATTGGEEWAGAQNSAPPSTPGPTAPPGIQQDPPVTASGGKLPIPETTYAPRSPSAPSAPPAGSSPYTITPVPPAALPVPPVVVPERPTVPPPELLVPAGGVIPVALPEPGDLTRVGGIEPPKSPAAPATSPVEPKDPVGGTPPPLPGLPAVPPATPPSPTPAVPPVAPLTTPVTPVAPTAPMGTGGPVVPEPGSLQPVAPLVPTPAPKQLETPPEPTIPVPSPMAPAVPPVTPAPPAGKSDALPVPPIVSATPSGPPEMNPTPGVLPPIDVTPKDVTPKAPGVGTPATFTKPGGTSEVKPVVPESQPKTSFDVDLYEPKAGDSYEAISQEYYNDRRFAAALRTFNRNLPLQGGRAVEVPPIHILRKRYPGQTGAVVPIGASPGAGPDWGPAGGAKSNLPRGAGSGRGTFTVPTGGMKLEEIGRQLGVDWRDVYDLNPQHPPGRVIPAGTELKMP